MAAAASIALVLGGVFLLVLNQQSLLDGFQPHLIIFGTTFPIIGWLIAKRLPDNRVSWILIAGSLSWAITFFANEYALFVTFTRPASLPGGAVSAWIGSWIWIPGTALFTTVFPLLFPDGRLVSQRWRALVVLIGVGALVATVAQAIAPWPDDGGAARLAGTADLSHAPGAIGFLSAVGMLVTFVAPLAAAASVFARMRRAVGVERLQMRWFAYAMAVLAVTMIADELLPAIGGVLKPSVIGVLVMPISIAIAIFRYRLYEIDRIISRTISWTLTTGVIVTVFAGIVVGLQGVMAQVTGGGTIAVAGSTLVVAALFQPLRRRVQGAVDHRFNRARYDAQRTTDLFAEQLRNEVDLTRIGGTLLAAANGAVTPQTAIVWLRAGQE